ncbi:hypothetical protein DAMNIGENAA_17530 [Desulforhabdus amnigena]|jgi:hypothetical protein|uniref:Uncharacterized protein n=1 Tax=Desulforhabdus amnigena TaxID=40218 RepID=A0A9W6D1U7_9BACT|nr:hypothetical protein DAMNIGENAA_17530 [Desulforhabdus amnigena]
MNEMTFVSFSFFEPRWWLYWIQRLWIQQVGRNLSGVVEYDGRFVTVEANIAGIAGCLESARIHWMHGGAELR